MVNLGLCLLYFNIMLKGRKTLRKEINGSSTVLFTMSVSLSRLTICHKQKKIIFKDNNLKCITLYRHWLSNFALILMPCCLLCPIPHPSLFATQGRREWGSQSYTTSPSALVEGHSQDVLQRDSPTLQREPQAQMQTLMVRRSRLPPFK